MTRKWILFFAILTGSVAFILRDATAQARRFTGGYDFNSATGFHTGQDLEDLVEFATPTTNLVDNSTLSINASTQIIVKSGGIGTNQLATNSVFENAIINYAVTSNKIATGAVDQVHAPTLVKSYTNNTRIERSGNIALTNIAMGGLGIYTMTFSQVFSTPPLCDVIIDADSEAGSMIYAFVSSFTNRGLLNLSHTGTTNRDVVLEIRAEGN